MKEALKAVQEVGFPIAVAIYLLWRDYTRIKEQTKVLSEICSGLDKLIMLVKGEQ